MSAFVFAFPAPVVVVVVADGGRAVTRAKNDMSVLMRGQGSVPFRPIPRRVFVVGPAAAFAGEGMWIGVVATMRVRGTGRGGVGIVALLDREGC